jgi:hypothetical protein
MVRKYTRVHPTTDQKKVSVVHSKGHKLQTNTVAQNGKEALRRAGKMLGTVAKFATDPLNNAEKFKRELALNAEEIKILEQIKKAIEGNFADIENKIIPQFKNAEVTKFMNPIIALQRQYFERLSNLNFSSDKLDEQIETISDKYDHEFKLIIEDQINKAPNNALNIKSLHMLVDINHDTIEAFKANMHDLKAARNINKNTYRAAILCAASICLGVVITVFTSIAIAAALANPFTLPAGTMAAAFFLGVGIGIIGLGIGASIASLVNLNVIAPEHTKQYTESRKNLFDKLQLSLFQTCTTLRNFITANEPKLKAS